MRNINRVVLFHVLLVLAIMAVGCQRGPTWNLAPVEGTVTQAGRPLAGIQVVFLADLEAGTQGPRTLGTTDKDGRYRLRTHNGDWGAAIGQYRVCLFEPDDPAHNWQVKLPKERVVKLPAPSALKLPPAYGRFDETPLRAEVHPSPQVIDLEVK